MLTQIATVGERIQRLRLAKGMSQSDLASAIGLRSNGLISKLENGRASVDSPLLTGVANALECSEDYLIRRDPEIIATRPWLRAYADAPAKIVESVTADNSLACEFALTRNLRWVPDSVPQFYGDLNDEVEIEAFAEEVRVAAGVIENGPVKNAMRAAERIGCVILPMGHELGRHLGLSQRVDGRPFIRVSRPNSGPGTPGVPGDRQRFTVAHEVGHLALHSGHRPPETAEEAKLIENQAHRFAAAFLAPADPLLEDWRAAGGRATLTTLQQLKGIWGYSIKALVMRFRQLGVIDDDHARSLYRQISARGWNLQEPTPVSTEEPIWLRRALMKEFPEEQISSAIASAARAHGISPDYVHAWIDWSAPNVADAEIHGLSPQPVRESDRESDSRNETGQVIQLRANKLSQPRA